MGILNVTPDSFSDGGHHHHIDDACQHARQLIEQGADIIDVGGESTRPGADAVTVDEEIRRTIPVIEAIRSFSNIPISIDTSKPEVMLSAAKAGATLINDVRALQEEGALDAAASTGLPVCLMHMQGQPRTMQHSPQYDELLAEIISFFQARIAACDEAGIERSRLMIDPGFGFGKTLNHNLELLARLSELNVLDLPVLIGVSRKSMFQHLLGLEVNDRLHASLAAAVIAMRQGAAIIRVHDVRAHVEARGVFTAVSKFNP